MLNLWLRHTIFHKIEGKQTNEFNISRIKSFPLYSSMKKKHIAATFWQFGAFASLVSLKKKLFTITQTSQNYSCLKMSKYILVIVFFFARSQVFHRLSQSEKSRCNCFFSFSFIQLTGFMHKSFKFREQKTAIFHRLVLLGTISIVEFQQ